MARDIQAIGGTSSATPAQAGQEAQTQHGEKAGRRLGAFLCWAVVFADIGTSVYYTPGILFGQYHQLAGFFVILTLGAFVLLTLKYAEVSMRFPEGGGVVTVAARALNPWAGVVGGMFILVDYFLTSAISSLSGLQYFQNVVPAIGPYVLPLTIAAVAALGVLNWWGIKESAVVSAAIAVTAFVSDIVILVLIFWYVPLPEIFQVFRDMFSGPHLTGLTVLTGFAGAFLAFSGLESISQLAPVMRIPRRKTVSAALAFVAISVGITSPLLTMFSTILLDPAHRRYVVHPIANPDPNQFISLLGSAYGGTILGVATAIVASALLIFASNTAIIGAYHVFLALSRMGFLPRMIDFKDKFRGTPLVAIGLATGIPIVVLIAASGQINILGELYAFGLLGAFSLTCIGLDVARIRERRGAPHIGALDDPELHGLDPHQVAENPPTGKAYASVAPASTPAPAARPAARGFRRWWEEVDFVLGIATTIMVVTAWCTNLVNKPLATAFGGGLTVLGVGVAIVHFRYQARKGSPVPLVSGPLPHLPHAVVALLSPSKEHNLAVEAATIRAAQGRPVVFVYVGEPQQRAPAFLEVNDPYLFDIHAQRGLSSAAAAATRAGLNAKFIYRVGTPGSVAQRLRVSLHPDEIIAAVSEARSLSSGVVPKYVRYQVIDGVRIATYLLAGANGKDGAKESVNNEESSARNGRGAATDTEGSGETAIASANGERSVKADMGVEGAAASANGAREEPGQAGATEKKTTVSTGSNGSNGARPTRAKEQLTVRSTPPSASGTGPSASGARYPRRVDRPNQRKNASSTRKRNGAKP